MNTSHLTLATTLAAISFAVSCSTEQEQANPPSPYYVVPYVQTESAVSQIKKELDECRYDLEILEHQHKGWTSTLHQMMRQDNGD